MKKHFLLFIGLCLFVSIDIALAQCAMCKAVVESDLQGGNSTGTGINNGIIYLMLIPYLLLGGAGYFIYKHYKKTH
ncbi:MAG: hypothetical protein Kow0079_00930 [Vicingaceae bacterium]